MFNVFFLFFFFKQKTAYEVRISDWSSDVCSSDLLAEKLLSLVPDRAAGRVWLGHSGSDANETVARAVVAASGRKRILSFKGAYHGGSEGRRGGKKCVSWGRSRE